MQLSIIIPVYNVEEYFRECLMSVVALQNICFEVIIIHDSLVDNSLNNVEDIISQNENIIVVDRKNAGLSVARNDGLEIAKGDYIYFLDSDDKIIPKVFERIFFEGLIRHADIMTGRYMCWNGSDCVDNEVSYKASLCTGEYYLTNIYPKDIAVVWKGIYSRSLFEKYSLKFSRLKYFEDEDWTPRMFSHANVIYCTNSVFYLYRVRDCSLSNAKFNKHKFSDLLQVSDNLVSYSQNFAGDLKTAFQSLSFRCLLAIVGKMDHIQLSKEENESFISRIKKVHTVWPKYRLMWVISRISCRVFIKFIKLLLKLKSL